MLGRAVRALSLLIVAGLSACGGQASPASPATQSGSAIPASAAPASSAPAASSSASPQASLTTLKIAHVPSTLFSPLYVAIDKGYMRQQGINADLTVVAAGQDAMAFLGNGQLDAAVAGLSVGTFNAVNQGLTIRIVSSMGVSPRSGDPSALMVRSDEVQSGAIKSAVDLKGKKIGASGGLGATGSYYLAQLLAKANLTLKDVEVLNLGFADMVTGFKNKSLDAAIPSAPFTTQILSEGTAQIPDFGHLPPGVSGTGTIYGLHLLQDKQLGTKLMNALVMGARDVQGEQARNPENLKILANYTKLPVETLQNMALYDFRPDLAPDLPTYQTMQEVFISSGLLKLPQPLTATALVDDTFSKTAAAAK